MESGPDDVTVRLAERIPVFIVYGTAIVYPDGEGHFYDDLYGHDLKLAEALSKVNVRSSPTQRPLSGNASRG